MIIPKDAENIHTPRSVGKSKSMTQRDIKDFCIEVFNKVPDYLSKVEASTIIQELMDR